MAAPAVQMVGFDDLRKGLKTLENPQTWKKELGTVHRVVARKNAAWAQAAAGQMGGQQRHFASAIKGYGSPAAARLAIANKKANAAYWGAEQRTGWNAGNEARNQPPHVGNSWEAAVRGEGPIVLNDSLADHLDETIDDYGDGVDRLTRRAGFH